MSNLFLRTLRDDPSDAELPGHRKLVRAGYVRRSAPGVYSWMPLGLRVLRKVEQIVRTEMNAIGGQELLFPALLPREPYEATNRWSEYGENLFRVKDRKGADMLLGPTHEEMFTLAVKDMYNSYKDLPATLYQFQNKYRDEARPRGGLLRGREFFMKDSYSFDIDDAGLEAAYQRHREAYIRIFEALGLEFVVVKATSGAMGGSASEEFLAVSENGEDTFVTCDESGYAANVEAVEVPRAAAVAADVVAATGPARQIDTPDASTIESLVDVLDEVVPEHHGRAWSTADTLKNVVVMLVYPDGTRRPLVIGLPGDRQVDAKRLEAQVVPAEVEAFTDADFATWPALVKGYIGPTALGPNSGLDPEDPQYIRYCVDPSVAQGSAWATGANVAGAHVIDLVLGRDFDVDGVIQAGEIRDGDPSPDGAGLLRAARGIEMGHVFQLGRKYAEALGLKVLDENGKLVTVTMGSYGVGVSRAVAALAEANVDDAGLVWPRNVSPMDVHVVATGKGEAIFQTAQKVVDDLSAAGIDVLYDDRPKVSPGVKFKDAELIGVPTIVVLGKGLAADVPVAEIKDRRTGERREVPLAELVQQVKSEISG
ncbi:proline--tRNA ligase [Dermatophilus congolensis]|uniref:Proline--tRNA ligase n=1 Tax=Dermatophilus congolensis TaxID=1863 RepID=A0A239VGF1_9MICO|nr:proline--tRNA ligase [Dermatophilus congolensis]MBO3128868.1 proline--tRNA ligase [Dermatophilus congolensis]MBO3132494.1 proline--tRNA ligase [Dermatophilus congolensis]MBO3133345.1 proline--tRNA ligase [Dermatophilus congolensis]MBO3135580.1 proline--tRNA ligase [Dermatophilus congolensis]MBO3137819.1 proline--tRNA ligase [Dermatophilus congolensis]